MDDPRAGALPFGGEEAASSFDAARVVVLPVPYEGTVSYEKGASRGPEAILRASGQVELYDERMASVPYEVGIWTAAPLSVDPGEPAKQVARTVALRTGELMDAGKWVVVLGGEHSITAGSVRAASSRVEGLHVVQLDAHADLRESYEGDRWSHACAMARCLEVAPVRAVGIRSYSAEEAERMRRGIPGYAIVHAWEMDGDRWVDAALDGLDGKPVYLTVDADYFDPSLVPSTGTPEPGGGGWWPTVRFLEALFDRVRVVACDVVELAPVPGLHHADFTLARLVYKMVGLAARSSIRS